MATSLDWPQTAAPGGVPCAPPGERKGVLAPPLGLSLPPGSPLLSRFRPRFPEPCVLAALGLGQLFATG
jgi:hypothetical protein